MLLKAQQRVGSLFINQLRRSNMAGFGSFTLLDHNGEITSTSFNTGNVTALSLPGLLTQFGALRTAIDGIVLGTISKESLKVFDTPLSNDLPVDQNAQRERKWLVVYEDNLPFFDAPLNAIPNEGYRKRFSFEIGTADIANRLVPNTDRADLANTQVAAFVTAFEAIARSPYGGTTNVLEIRSVGRNI
jgi:hypothetical protein